MEHNAKISEQLAVLACINPASQGAGSVSSAWVDMANTERILGLVQVGAFGASATVDAKLEQATSSGGAGAKDITGKAITQLLAAGGNNRQALINARMADLDTNNSFRYVRLTITVGTAATLVAGGLFGGPNRYEPKSQVSTVAEVKG